MGALDSVHRHGDEPDLATLHVELAEVLAEILSGPELERALDRLDHHLQGAGRQFERAHQTEDDEEPNGMPRNGREHGMGGRLAELEGRDRKRRMARDEAAYDRAEQSFNKMFPDASRIKQAL